MPLTGDRVMVLEYSKIIKEQSRQHRLTLDRLEGTNQIYQSVATKAHNQNDLLQAENKALKACVESHERTIKALKEDIQRRINEEDASITMFVADMADVRCEVYRLYKNRIDAENFDKVVKCCFGFMKNTCEVSKGFLSDSVQNWWETGGAECWEKEEEPPYAPKSDTE